MALKINTRSPHWKEIVGILHQFADHANSGACEICSVQTGAYCSIGGAILHELTKFGDDVESVPEDWGKKKS
jgi:hypothetical protein